MEKTKLGIPVSLMAALICLLGFYGGYVAAALMTGYVLLAEENCFIRRMAGKVLAVLLAFSLLNTLINLIPNLLSLIHSGIHVFSPDTYIEALYSNFLTRLVTALSSVLSLCKTVLFLMMGLLAFKGKEMKLPVVDKLLDKCCCKDEV